MYEFTTPFIQSEIAYRTERIRDARGLRRGRGRVARVRREPGESRR